MAPALEPAVTGERFEFVGKAGRLSAYVAGEGPPMLLVHSINAAASVAEVRPLHEHFRSAGRTVFSLDLPGFGFSDRSERPYTPRLMTDAIHDAVEQVRRRCGKAPIDALGLSLGCEFLARASAEAQGSFRTLALVSPTGFRGTQVLRGPAGSTRALPWLYAFLRGPGWGDSLYNALTRPGVIRYFLRKTWGSADIDEELWRACVVSARQAGAANAPLQFLSGNLFSADIHAVYEAVQAPVWMSHGQRGDFTDYRGKSIVERRSSWRITVYPTGAIPYFEIPERFMRDYEAFLASTSGGAASG